MPRYVALLRGINLGATRRVAMPALRATLEAAGHEDVRTLAQSGNVVLTSAAEPAVLEHDLAATLGETFGFAIPVVVRTRDELAAVLAADPFGDDAHDPALLQVSLLSAPPDPERASALEAAAVPPERVAVRGREIYAWHPDGVARSDLAKRISARRLGVEVTARNRRTLTKLLALADAA